VLIAGGFASAGGRGIDTRVRRRLRLLVPARYRQHDLHLVPLLPAVDSQIPPSEQSDRGRDFPFQTRETSQRPFAGQQLALTGRERCRDTSGVNRNSYETLFATAVRPAFSGAHSANCSLAQLPGRSQGHCTSVLCTPLLFPGTPSSLKGRIRKSGRGDSASNS